MIVHVKSSVRSGMQTVIDSYLTSKSDTDIERWA